MSAAGQRTRRRGGGPPPSTTTSGNGRALKGSPAQHPQFGCRGSRLRSTSLRDEPEKHLFSQKNALSITHLRKGNIWVNTRYDVVSDLMHNAVAMC